MLKLRKNKKGFTLVELIVVIAIMAVLAGTVAGVTVSQLNKQTNNSAKTEVDGLINDFKTFMLDYDGTIGDDGAGLADAVAAFATEAGTTKNITDLLTAKGEKLPKAGEHKFAYEVDGKTVTFSCQGKGTNAAVIEAEYIYSDVLGG